MHFNWKYGQFFGLYEAVSVEKPGLSVKAEDLLKCLTLNGSETWSHASYPVSVNTL